MRLSLSYDTENEDLQGKIDFVRDRLYVARTMIPEGYEAFFQETARYTSVHTSTAIEGNTIDESTAMVVLVEGADADQPLQVEKVNLDAAYELMNSLVQDKTMRIDEGIIRTINSMVLKDLPDSAARNRGKYRPGSSLIVDAATREPRYLPPQPAYVPELMTNFVADIVTWIAEYPGPIAAAMAHFGLISIHPFEDGNGRTARLIADMILNLKDSAADGMISVSRVLHDQLPDYYATLRSTQGENFKEDVDVTEFALFHTDALVTAAVSLEQYAIAFRRQRDEYARTIGDMMNERQATGMMFMTNIGAISTSHYARLTKSSQATALADLALLIEKGVAERVGSGKNTRYRLHPDIVAKAGELMEEEAATT